MQHTHSYTGPERTSFDIAADRKAANAFFAAYDHPDQILARDAERLIRFYQYDWKLLRCVIDAQPWMRAHPKNTSATTAARLARRAAAEAAEVTSIIPGRDDSELRSYVDGSTAETMPAPAYTNPAGGAAAQRVQARRFWARCAHPGKALQARLQKEIEPFVQWLMLNPLYGPQHDAPEGYTGSLRPVKITPVKRVSVLYKRGEIRPAGMSYQRALQIAIAVLNAEQ